MTPTSDVAFTPAVKAIQAARGSRHGYEKLEARGGWAGEVTDDLAAWLAERDSFYLATANAAGQPYIQHRGGPPGFLKVLGPQLLGFADYRGNRQYISLGNLTENDKIHLFLMDYASRQRIKIWGTARVETEDRALIASLMPEGYRATPEQAILIRITAWDANCPQHIPQKFGVADVQAALAQREARVAELEAELALLRGGGA